jgi:hypothetical protein
MYIHFHVGSSTLFAALLIDLYKKKLIAICTFMRSASSQPRIAALMPQLEVISEDDSQIQPMGFNLIQLPFQDEIQHKVKDHKEEIVTDDNEVIYISIYTYLSPTYMYVCV